ncbi:chaperonin 10-like protein [Amylostereum chailletii]|nr:chaperonin 10-like protein [Amylostereum chailletii]
MSDALPESYKAVCCPGAHQPWQHITLPLRSPAPSELLLKVHASGLCGSEHFIQSGSWPGITYPRVPGHEVVARVLSLGPDVDAARFKAGDLVGVGWSGGFCSKCRMCREGEFWACEKARVTGFTHDGGAGEYMYAPESAIVSIPEECLATASYAELAPLLCAGMTVYGALLSTPFKPGDTCLVQGVGGLGHLAIQYASKLGLRVFASSSSPAKAALAKSLGAHAHIDASAVDVAAYMQARGGAAVVLCTAPNADEITKAIGAVATNGTVTLVSAAVDGDIRVQNVMMNMRRATLRGYGCGVARDAEACLRFSAMADIKSMVREYKLEQYAEAYDDMIAGGPKFRNVIVFP